ncbi:carboxy-S-adenosyl-L-methionine synthase CmoA [Alkalimarinus coralli]|uniref:carboxy-S-adenosyl-L-methionine synthase CmoA n=1 Tax=Alkalimarinus coralli TaxID=2935863 RepID=UPI00202B0FB1|nr:carboxy-S-adenosyl-L-methionine synthase CmoA [Alkalimarinus coralli]
MVDQQPDNIYASPLDRVTDFAFDDAVARVFPDMIQRSVPGYTTIIPMIGLITERYAKPDTNCYDLGCSLGASTLAMRHGLKNTQCKLVAIDNSEAMIKRCEHYIELDNGATPVDLRCDDIRNITIENASVVTLNFTLQFIRQADRPKMLKSIANGLRKGGALILSEKVHFSPTAEQEALEALHYDFKRANGYSDLEISQKRSALEQVLIPETIEEHKQRLLDSGFSEALVWYQCFNFVSFLAIK